ncbi:MAG: hypothetical protein ACPGXK_14645, partial [Phycisphaerae bacterium]
ATRRVEVVQTVEYGADALSNALTGMMGIAVLVMLIAGLAAAGMVRGVVPSIIETVNANLLIFSAGSLGLSLIVTAVLFVLGRRGS